MKSPVVAGPAPEAHRRNVVWRTIQTLLQNVFVFWLQYRARGEDQLPIGGGLLLINHQSFLDPLLVGLPLHRPVSFVARDNLFRVPVIGWILRSTYVMPIRREAAGSESLRICLQQLEQGRLVGIFPEGTRSSDGQLSPLKPGFIALVRRSPAPVIPVGLAGAFEALPRRARWLRPSRVRVVFGRPTPPAELAPLLARGRETELVQYFQGRLEECRRAAEEWRRASS
jgi:1-acyl-sn-glycerol-3-phosphate acyltransferase